MAIVQAKLDEAQAEFDRAMAQKQALEEDAAATQKKMDSANALISALAGEEIRWTEQSKEFDTTIQRLTGDCCIASAFVSYLGPFNKEFRDLLIKRDFFTDCRDQDVPTTPNMNLTAFLVDDSTIGQWNLQGLPTDDLSIQNGIMVNNAARYPVLVDPQGQARTWIVNKELKNELRVSQLNDKMFRCVIFPAITLHRSTKIAASATLVRVRGSSLRVGVFVAAIFSLFVALLSIREVKMCPCS